MGITTNSRLIGGLLVSTAIASVAVQRHALTPGGAASAIGTGTLLVAGGGVRAGASMVAFFLTSTALSRLGRTHKARLAANWEKSDRRDAAQVLANGSVATLCAVLYGLTHDEGALHGCSGALTTAAADTWSTEVGALYGRAPRLITSGHVVSAGTSGAVSLAGCFAAVAGAAVTSAIFWLARPKDVGVLSALGCAACGVVGSLIDSVLGATVQAQYHCPTCDILTERRVHGCGTATSLFGGFGWCTNDVVNVLTTAVGSLLAIHLGQFAASRQASRTAETKVRRTLHSTTGKVGTLPAVAPRQSFAI